MTAKEFRRVALSFPGAVEKTHVGHPDFRVDGKIFATLGYPDPEHSVVMLTPEVQQRFVTDYPAVFSPANGAWGRRGSTVVLLKVAKVETVRSAMETAWKGKKKSKR
jgi:hypothetical protein